MNASRKRKPPTVASIASITFRVAPQLIGKWTGQMKCHDSDGTFVTSLHTTMTTEIGSSQLVQTFEYRADPNDKKCARVIFKLSPKSPGVFEVECVEHPTLVDCTFALREVDRNTMTMTAHGSDGELRLVETFVVGVRECVRTRQIFDEDGVYDGHAIATEYEENLMSAREAVEGDIDSILAEEEAGVCAIS